MSKTPHKPEPRWMSGHTCYVCGEGSYEGYQDGPQMIITMPCQVCDHTMPACIDASALKLVVEVRDKSRDWDRKQRMAAIERHREE